ncbi:MAG TPA: aromatic ring-hydroxylating dioxygenase subunit alpha [Blastocatellia bacterium]|nr:aromatic ring-hydroxylating dioxygenase subunit alpha [Blastocatellia bacterium]
MPTGRHAKKWTTRYPHLGTDPIPIEPYISQKQFEREMKRIYRRTWLNVGREDQIPDPGNFFVKDIDAINSSILVVRGRDGVIRAFHNMCSHRSNKVARQSCGSARSFVCGFHGWAYDLSGELVHVPDEGEFFGLDKKECGLTRVAVGVWEGFIFINADPTASQSLSEFLGELREGLAGYPFASMSLAGHYRAEVRANWKVTLNSFQEGYHVPFLHRQSAGRAYADRSNPTVHALAFHLYKLHRTMSISGSASYVPTPVEILSHRFSTSITKVTERQPGGVLPAPGLNPSRSPGWVFDMIVLFPNFFLFLFEGTYFTYHFWPLAVDHTVWETRTYHPPPENAAQRFSQEYSKCSLRDTLLEDGNTLEAVQANLASGAKRHFILSDQELLIRHSHFVIESLMTE